MAAAMSQTQVARWSQVRRKGLLRFMVLHGVIMWGGLTLVLWLGSTWLFASQEYFARTFLSQPFFLLTAVALGGLLFGFLVWHFNEQRYKHSLEDDQAQQ
jgi:hypothetical protein